MVFSKMIMRAAGVFALSMFIPIGSSAEVGTVPAQPPSYDLSEFAPYAGHGAVDVTARLVVSDMGPFGTHEWSHVVVTAVPRRPYNVWFYARAAYCLRIRSNCYQTPLVYPAALRQFNHTAISDDRGYFTMHDLHPGRYLYYATIKASQYSQHIVNGTKTVVTPDGEPVSVSDAHLEGDGGDYVFAVLSQVTVSATNPIVPNFDVLSFLETS